MTTVAEILEQAARRDRALATGGSHIPIALRSQAGPLPGVESPNDRPLLRWPSERHLIPTACHVCRAQAMATDAPYGLVRDGDVRCLLCSRVVVRLRADNTERAPIAVKPLPQRVRPPRTPTRQCARCGAACYGAHCIPCQHEDQAKWPLLVELLADGQPRRARDIRAALGISNDSLRQFVYKARREGHPIRSGVPFGTYRLEVGS